MNIVPLNPVPSQTLSITLNNQQCTINVYEKDTVSYDGYIVDQYGQPLISNSQELIGTGLDTFALPQAVYLDLYVSGVLIIGGVLCLNQNLIVRSAYLSFIGDLAFYDQQGATDPVYTGLGSRYLLFYFAPGDT